MKRILNVALCVMLLLALVPALSQTASAESLSHFDIRLTEPVASYRPDFSPEFNTGIQLYSSVTWQENSPGFSNKLSSSDEFEPGLAYKAVIWVKFSDGNYLATDIYGDLAATITVNGNAISSLKINGRNAQGQISEVTITCEYDPLSGREIGSALITGIPTPMAGNMPIYSFTIGNEAAYGFYHTQPVVWWDKTTGKEISSGDTFIAGHQYQLELWLSSNRYNGFTFKLNSSGDPAVNVTLNSWAADSVITAYEQDPREVIAVYYTFPTCQSAHTHTPSEWRTTGIYHYKVCTTCGDFLEQEDHKGGVATCAEKGKCAVCGYEYIEVHENHTPDTSKWVIRGDMYHYHACKLCGAHCDIGDHVAGPAGTPDAEVVCRDCGYIITPAKGHEHKLTKVAQKDATCTEPGNAEYYTCAGCSVLFSDSEGKNTISNPVLAPLGHKASNDWKYDENSHWRICSVCNGILTETRQGHHMENEKCTTCGCDGSAPETSPGTEPNTEPAPGTDSEPERQDKNNGGLPWWALLLIVLSAAGAGVGGGVLVLTRKKKE